MILGTPDVEGVKRFVNSATHHLPKPNWVTRSVCQSACAPLGPN